MVKTSFSPYIQQRPQYPQVSNSYQRPPLYGSQVQRPNASQFFQALGLLMQAMQQLSGGWQAFGGMGYGLNPTQGVNPPPSYGQPTQYGGPIQSNPNPYSLLPSAQSSFSAHGISTSFGYAPPTPYTGPIQANPNPYSLLPAGQNS